MSIETFRAGLRSAVRGLWLGVLDYYQFYKAFEAAIGRHITEAWAEGMAASGVAPDEYSPEENAALATFLSGQYNYIGEFGLHIIAHDNAKRFELESLLGRVEIWANRYNEAKNRARAMAMADEKLVWRLGSTKDHCGSCRSLDGKVKRGSYWTQHAILPRSQSLKCGGWNCQCELIPTKDRITPGPLPKFM